jgi:hypothetical protein
MKMLLSDLRWNNNMTFISAVHEIDASTQVQKLVYLQNT